MDGAGRAVGVDDDDDDANQANTASAATIASTTSPRFIENTLTVPDHDPAAAGNLKPIVSCPFVPRMFEHLTVGVRNVNVRRPSLDDVFIQYTGRDMRDAEAGAGDQLRANPMVRGFRRG